MNDLIYGGNEYKKELEELFPSAIFSDASDETHPDRIGIDVNIEQDDYLRIIVLNGFIEMSLYASLFFMDSNNKDEIKSLTEKWKSNYPEYFRQQPLHGSQQSCSPKSETSSDFV